MIANCTFTSNAGFYYYSSDPFAGRDSASLGAGMYNTNASPIVTNCTFANNTVNDWGGGGGMCNNHGSPVVTDCTFMHNTISGGDEDSSGAGMYNTHASPTVTNCTFANNASPGDGGGIGNDNSSPQVTNCTFSNNEAAFGGGMMYGGGSSPITATDCIFTSNTASYGGGTFNASSSSIAISNCVFTNNKATHGGGTFNGYAPLLTVTNCTFKNNTASLDGNGMSGESDSSIITNCIFWNNGATTSAQVYNNGGSSTFNHCDIQNCGGSGAQWTTTLGTDDGGNIAADPLFVDAANPAGPDGIWRTFDDGLRLEDDSPCVNAGTLMSAPATDILDNPRVSRGVPDIGAYENQTEFPMSELIVYDDSTSVTQGTAVDLGTTTKESAALSKTLTIKNVGTGTLLVSVTSVGAPFQIVTAPAATVDIGSSTTLVVTLPTNMTGTFSGTLSIQTNDPIMPTFSITVTGKITGPALSVLNGSTTIANGGSIRLFTTTTGAAVEPTATLTIKNAGNDTMTIGSPSIALPFSITTAPAATVDAGSSTTLAVALNTATVGAFSKALTFTTNDPTAPTFSITINGTIVEHGATIYVKADAAGANNGTSWTDAYTDLHSALAAAQGADEIWVAAGTYKPTTGTDPSVFFVIPSNVAIYGGFAGTETSRDQRNWTTHATILGSDIGTNRIYSYHVVMCSDFSLVDGFTIHGGSYASDYGGGMYGGTAANCTFINNYANNGGGMSHGTAINCTFTNNSASYGGGMSYGTAINCTFTNNYASNGFSFDGSGGGGMYDGTATNCTFTNNVASFGGGMRDGTANNCTFLNNEAYNGGGMSYGTAISCTFASNEASDGGGMFNGNATNCAFMNNTASSIGVNASYDDGQGGGMLISALSIVTNCVFTDNTAGYQGGGMYNASSTSATLTNCTFVGNTAGVGRNGAGGGMYTDGVVLTLTNCIFWNNSSTYGAQVYAINKSVGAPTYKCCDIQGYSGSGVHWDTALGTDGGGNIAADPVFWDAATPAGADGVWRTSDDGLRLHFGSPCIDAGTTVGAPATDILGNSREGRPDIGAYEHQTPAAAEQWTLYR